MSGNRFGTCHCQPTHTTTACAACHGTLLPPLTLPTGFYDRPDLRAALARDDLGEVLRAVRRQTGLSQSRMAERLDMTQAEVSRIERGARHANTLALARRIANVLRIPPTHLGFRTATVSEAAVAARKVDVMDRRSFANMITAMALGVGTGFDREWFAAILDDSAGFRRVGLAEVDRITEAAWSYARQDWAHGSELAQPAAVAQLRAVLPLTKAEMTDDVRPRLLTATAHLGLMAGWMSFDVGKHADARRLWLVTLSLAQEAGNPDLAAYVLYDLALQSLSLDRPDEALHQVRSARAMVTIGNAPLSPSTRAHLAAAEARAHAMRGDAAACHRALGQAWEQAAAIDSADSPRWGSLLRTVGIGPREGAVFYDLAVARSDPRAAERAVERLREHLDFGPEYAKVTALYLPELAGAHALSGDVDTAVTVGHQAADAAGTIASRRVRDKLRSLHTVLEPLAAKPDVAELRHRLAGSAA